MNEPRLKLDKVRFLSTRAYRFISVRLIKRIVIRLPPARANLMQSGCDLTRIEVSHPVSRVNSVPPRSKGCPACADRVQNVLLRLRCCQSRNLTDAATFARNVGAILRHVTTGDVCIPYRMKSSATRVAITSDVSNFLLRLLPPLIHERPARRGFSGRSRL